MTKKQIERDMLRMFDTGSKKRHKLRWVQLVEAEGRATRRGRPKRNVKKPRR